MQSNIQKNIDLLNDIKNKFPGATHVYIKREDGIVVDIPIGHAEFTIRNLPTWELLMSNQQMDAEVEKIFSDNEEFIPEPLPEIPPKPSEIKPKRKARVKKHAKKTDSDGASSNIEPSNP